MSVAVVYQGSLLTEAVRSLLQGSGDVPTVEVDLGEERAVERLRALQPSVVVVDADDDAFRDCRFIRLLDEIPEVRLVCLHDGGEHVDVYAKTRISVHGARDLAAALGRA
ncbi:MAG: hypothetical protein KGN00_05655 [Chloroflexota bacterium]|nr:hypothetical protein [Chloroflexota bacterium]MDE3193155.1 hypothetical protein [Chloroflexota bacterium]